MRGSGSQTPFRELAFERAVVVFDIEGEEEEEEEERVRLCLTDEKKVQIIHKHTNPWP
jgi:hypothetical protein